MILTSAPVEHITKGDVASTTPKNPIPSWHTAVGLFSYVSFYSLNLFPCKKYINGSLKWNNTSCTSSTLTKHLMFVIDYKTMKITPEVTKCDQNKAPHAYSPVRTHYLYLLRAGNPSCFWKLFTFLQLFDCDRSNYFTRSLQLWSRLTKHASGGENSACQVVLTQLPQPPQQHKGRF